MEQQKKQWTGVEKEAGAAGVEDSEVGETGVRAALEEAAGKVQRRTREVAVEATVGAELWRKNSSRKRSRSSKSSSSRRKKRNTPRAAQE